MWVDHSNLNVFSGCVSRYLISISGCKLPDLFHVFFSLLIEFYDKINAVCSSK